MKSGFLERAGAIAFYQAMRAHLENNRERLRCAYRVLLDA